MSEIVLTQDEIDKVQIHVVGFSSIGELKRKVMLRAVFEDEERIFTCEVSTKKPREKFVYLRKAFMSVRKDIKQWVKSGGNSVVGTQISFHPNDFNDNVDDEE